MKKLAHVIYRKFEFEKYPPHIKNLRNYAWKLLLIGERGTILLFNTEDVKEHIMKWAAVCALVQDCIAPPGSNVIAPATVFGRHHKRSMAVFIDMIKLS